MFSITFIISAAKYIQRIRQPRITRIIIILSRRINTITIGSCIDCTTANIDLTHAERDTAIQRTAGNSQLTLARLVNCRTLFCSQRTTIYNKIHIASGIITRQCCAITSFDCATVHSNGAAITASQTIVIGNNLTLFASTRIFNGDMRTFTLCFNDRIILRKRTLNNLAIQVQRNGLARKSYTSFRSNSRIVYHLNGIVILCRCNSLS